MRPDPRRYKLIKRSSAFEPLLRLNVISAPTSGIGAYAFREHTPLEFFFLGLGALPILSLGVAYLYFLSDDPARLRPWKAD